MADKKKAGAIGILSTMGAGGFIQIYNGLDTRLRANEIEDATNHAIIREIKEDVKDVKSMIIKVLEKISD